MAQINIKKSTGFVIPNENCRAYGFNALGNPVYVDEQGLSYSLSSNTGRYVIDGSTLNGKYVPGSIRATTQADTPGYPSNWGVTYTFDANTPNRAFSIFAPSYSHDLHIQRYDNSGVGLGWKKIFTTANLEPLTLGDTSTYAYRGDYGKTAYDHSQVFGNPHSTTFDQLVSKPDTLAGYGITDAANAVHGHNYIVPILSGTLPETLTDYASYCANYHKGVSVIVNGGSSAVGNVGAIDTVVNFGSGRFRFFRLLNNRGGSLRWQTSNFDTTDFATERTLFDNYNFASYCPDLSAIESISDTNGLLRKTAANTWALDTNNYSLSTHQHSFASITNKPTTLSGYGITDALAASLKGAANGLAELDSGGKVPTSQLPSYVDDVLEYATFSLLPSVGESGKIYITTNTNKTYRWSGSTYTEISPSLALGETSATAYRGDRGKIAYDHSLATGNPHSTTFAQLGSTPNTLVGYGISDAYTKNNLQTSGSASVHWNNITSKPTTLSGYGITDASPSNINTGRYVIDGSTLNGKYVPGSIRATTQADTPGYPSNWGVTYTFDANTPNRAFSIFAPSYSHDLHIQRYDNSGVGLGWKKIFTTANLEPSNYLTKRYEPYLALNYNSTINWNCSTGLNKTLTASGDFTIKFGNLENGMSGDLRITTSTTITITLPSGSKLNGNVTNLPAGIYHLAWVYNGSDLDFNIASYE